MSVVINNENINPNADQYTSMWKQLWSVRDTAWHLSKRNPTLVKYADRLFEGKKNVRMLFPLCGKVIDMKYLWQDGHQVFGVDCAKEALEDFLYEQNLDYVSEVTCTGRKFSTRDNRLCLFNGNFLTFDNDELKGKIECVWDRGAFGTITEPEQDMYVATIRKLLAPNFRYLLLVTEFDQSKFDGVPFSQPEEKVHRYFGSFCNIEKLQSIVPEHVKLYQNHMKSPLDVKETTYLLTPKSV